MSSMIQPRLLRRMTLRKVLEVLRDQGPCTRAHLTRISGISAPTVSKAVESLIESGLVEEGDAIQGVPGRPGTLMRLATSKAQVIGVVLDARRCNVVSAGLDGTIDSAAQIDFDTPPTYEALLTHVCQAASRVMAREGIKTLGLGISTPGLINARTGRAMLSPNLHITDGHALDRDLSERLDIDCTMFQETQALCLGERMYGDPERLDDFVMLEISTGLGAGVMMGGRLMTGGASGLAGELGHVTVALDGPLCGCGNRGCLETLATDSALIRAVSERVGRAIDFKDVQFLLDEGDPRAEQALAQVREYLAIAVAAAINLWNPATLFIHGKLFDLRAGLFDSVCQRARERTLAPSAADCRILRARRSKGHGAVAAAIDHLFNTQGPE